MKSEIERVITGMQEAAGLRGPLLPGERLPNMGAGMAKFNTQIQCGFLARPGDVRPLAKSTFDLINKQHPPKKGAPPAVEWVTRPPGEVREVSEKPQKDVPVDANAEAPAAGKGPRQGADDVPGAPPAVDRALDETEVTKKGKK